MDIVKTLLALIFSFAVASATFRDICLTSHNRFRDLHIDTPPLIWDDGLAASAQAWADHLANVGLFYSNDSNADIGENVYGAPGKKQASCAEAVVDWYGQYKNYNYSKPWGGSSGAPIRNFARLVWKSSLKLGVGVATFQRMFSKWTVIVAYYAPGKNWPSNREFKQNVMMRKDPRAKVPSKYDLDPSLCFDVMEESLCKKYSRYGLCAKRYVSFRKVCAKTCDVC